MLCRILLVFLVLGMILLSGCVTPELTVETPRHLIEEYVLAYNRGDADTIYDMLVVFDSPNRHPRYATKEDVEQIIHEKRMNEGIRIADFYILEDYMIENYAVISLNIIWEHEDGEQLMESRDVGFVYVNGDWRMVDLILPPSF